MSCKKCNSPKTIILRKKDYYCNDCFITSTNHKFRACLGKSKVLLPNQNVLICLSGGLGSTVLLDLIHHGISLDSTKKLRIVPFFLHLFDVNQKDVAEHVLQECKKLNFDVYLVPISNYMTANYQLPKINCIPHLDGDIVNRFQNMMNDMSPTAANDFLLIIKRTLFVQCAKQLKCDFVFTAETTSTLAINLLCNLAIGRGSQVQNDIGFSDFRDENVKTLRPMKDISKEELDYYVEIKHLQHTRNDSVHDKGSNSLQSVISSFVCDLQENFQSTISTVCKTADKIGACKDDLKLNKCLLCESDLNIKDLKLSALEATNISRTVSFGNNQMCKGTQLSSNFDREQLATVFPFVHTYLCYGCSRNHSEMNQSNLPQHLQKYLQMYESII